jgi:carbonic anhydrase
MTTPSAFGCTCCGDILSGLNGRRGFLKLGGAGLMAAALPGAALAADGATYDSMVLSCIDPRFVNPAYMLMHGRGLTRKYSQFSIAGAAIGVVAPAFEKWRVAFWDNIKTSVKLHGITRLIAIDHADCGAAKIAYGDASIATHEAEIRTHTMALTALRDSLKQELPNLAFEGRFMTINPNTVRTLA